MVNIYQLDRDRCDLDYNQTGLEAIADVIEQASIIVSVME